MQARSPFEHTVRFGYLLAFVCLACAWLPLRAATPASAASAGDPPTDVARVAYLAGAASLLPAGASQWQDIEINRPLTNGDEVATGAGARVEVQFDGAIARLAGDTSLTLLALGQWQTQLALTRGTAALDVATLPDGQYVEIDTPQVALVIDRSARVRVDLGSGGTASTVTVRRGSVVVHGDDGQQQVVRAGQRYRFSGPELADAVALTYGGGDAFDRWAESRDQLYADARDGQYIAPGMVGYQDLDRYGAWSSEPDYGEVWFPDDVQADWVPYRNGRWVSIAPWGMTWVSNEPWGFAPFHYGRWARIHGRWGWLPGVVSVRAVYAPALVGFFGGSGWHVSVGLAVGAGPLVGWYPLGPGMVYNPWYGAGWGYYWRVNRRDYRYDHRTPYRGHYRDREVHVREAYNAWRKPRLSHHMRFLGQPPHGITIVARKSLEHGHDVRRAHLRVADNSVRRAPVRFRGLDIAPRGTSHVTWHPGRPIGAQRRPVVALHQPPAVSVGALRHARAAPSVRHTAPVRLLTADARTWERGTHRPLPVRTFHAAPPTRDAHAARRMAPVAAPNVARLPRPDAAITPRHGVDPHGTLPRVPRLELRTHARIQGEAALPSVSRMDPADRPRRAVRDVDRDDPPVYRADAFRAVRRPITRERPTVQPRAVEREQDTRSWRTPAPRSAPAPVRRAAPVRWQPAPATRMPEQRGARFHVSPPAAHSRHVTSGKSAEPGEVRSGHSHRLH